MKTTKYDIAQHLPAEKLTPAYARQDIAQRLESAILSGVLAPGARIKQEALTRIYGVSRMPVREALRQLCAKGLLVDDRNKGMRVAEPAPQPPSVGQPIAYVLTLNGEVYYETGDGIVISNTPGDELTEQHKWVPVYAQPPSVGGEVEDLPVRMSWSKLKYATGWNECHDRFTPIVTALSQQLAAVTAERDNAILWKGEAEAGWREATRVIGMQREKLDAQAKEIAELRTILEEARRRGDLRYSKRTETNRKHCDFVDRLDAALAQRVTKDGE